MVGIKHKRFIIVSLGTDLHKGGYLHRKSDGKYHLSPELTKAEFFHSKPEAEEVVAYWKNRIGLPLYIQPVGVLISDDLTDALTLPNFELKALQRVFIERVRVLRGLVKKGTYQKEQALLSSGADLVKELGILYKTNDSYDATFRQAYRGYHIVGELGPKEEGLDYIRVLDFAAPTPEEKRVYTYQKDNRKKRLRLVQLAKIFIDEMDGERIVQKHL